MKAELTRSYDLSALHILQRPGLSLEENLALFGPCARLHGHDYRVAVTIGGAIDERTGEVADREILDRVVDSVLIQPFAGSLLNDHFELPTGEVLARDFYRLLAPELPGLVRVAVVETAKNRFRYPSRAVTDPRG